MLGLKLPTDPRWVNIVEKNIEEIIIHNKIISISKLDDVFVNLQK